MPFQSILELDPVSPSPRAAMVEGPALFHDLNLDQLVAEVTAAREQYDLAPFFYEPVATVDTVRYRHEALRDLETEELLGAVQRFAQSMTAWRKNLARIENLHYGHERERLFLTTVSLYCEAVSKLATRLAEIQVRSRAFVGLREYLAIHVERDEFTALRAETEQVQDALAEVRYTIHVKGGRVTVGSFQHEPDYSAEIEQIFAKFRQSGDEEIRPAAPPGGRMNHIEAQIIDRVELLHRDAFDALRRYCERHADFVDPVIARFERESQFYLAYLEYIARLKAAGLRFCYPRVSVRSKEIEVQDGFDIVLAAKRSSERPPVVVNSFCLSGSERILVVTGPNNGGKTTFARMVGQLHYLAALGLPVPAASARLLLPDRVFTHFEREEDIATLRGKLEDELMRIRDILDAATGLSVIVMNESFSSTTLSDTRFLGGQIIDRLVAQECIAVYVTFVDELASLNDATVSMVATVAVDDPSVRTFRIVRQPADGLAYAAAIARKYGLTYDSVRRRVAT